jgi:hypothetical protein
VPASRRKTLFILVPFGLVLGIFAIASELHAHGFSTVVVAGLLGGGFVSGAMLVYVVPRWNKPRSRQEKQEISETWARTRPLAVGIGLAGTGVLTAIGAIAGGSVRALGSFAMAGCGVLFVVVTGIVAAMAITRPDFWE